MGASTDEAEVGRTEDDVARRGGALQEQLEIGIPTSKSDVAHLYPHHVRGGFCLNDPVEIDGASVSKRKRRDFKIGVCSPAVGHCERGEPAEQQDENQGEGCEGLRQGLHLPILGL